MGRFGWQVFCVFISISAQSVAETSEDKWLKNLAPETRIIQACDVAGMKAIGRDRKFASVDRVVVDALSPPTIKANEVTGSGGALRAAKRWYAFDFSCATTPDMMKATKFSYKMGAEIPQAKWEQLGLY